MDFSRWIPVLALILTLASQGIAIRTSQKIYAQVSGISACFRRFNGTKQIGCSSKMGGNVGVLHYVDDEDSLKSLLDGPHKPYAALITPHMFIRSTMNKIRESKKVNAVLIDYSNTTDAPSSFSPDSSCPNQDSSLYKDNPAEAAKCKWNSDGNALMTEDWEFPIIVLKNASDVYYLVNHCYGDYNKPNPNHREYPLCSVSVKDEMYGAVNTPTCMRRNNYWGNLINVRYCDPLGDHNIHAVLGRKDSEETLPPKSVIMVGARLDGKSMFEDTYPAADSSSTGLVTLLAVAQALGKYKEEIRKSPKLIMFQLFNGEAFDYMGSERWLYDVEQGAFTLTMGLGETAHPLNLEHLDSYIEVSQVAAHSGSQDIFLHSDPISRQQNTSVDDKVKEMLANFTSFAGDLPVKVATADMPLPPASFQTLLKGAPIPGLVMSNHDDKYTNKYYESRFDSPFFMDDERPIDFNDTEENVQKSYDMITPAAEHLTKTATVLAKTLYKMATGKDEDIEADNTTVTHLLYCFLHRSNCTLLNEVFTSLHISRLENKPFSFYVGIYATNSSIATLASQALLGKFLGEKQENFTQAECSDADSKTKVYHYLWLNGPLKANSTSERIPYCIKTTANYSKALSPAFEIDGYDLSSGKYTAWTESVWGGDSIDLKIFLVPSKGKEVAILVSGLALFAVSLVLVYFLDKNGSHIFSS